MGTILGSLAAGIVMLYLNYHSLGRANLARTVATWGSALLITIMLIASFVPSNSGSALIFMALQAVIAYLLADKLQGPAIRYHQQHDGAMHSNVRAAGVGFLAGLALFFLLMIATAIWMLLTGEVPAGEPAAGVPAGT